MAKSGKSDKKSLGKVAGAAIPTLGEAKVPSPLWCPRYVTEDDDIMAYIRRSDVAAGREPVFFEQAGPREKLYFDSSKTKCAVATCGGLCPGLNDVIRSIVMEARFNYRVTGVLGFRYGLEGFIPKYGHEVVDLTPDLVSNIHEFGGTILGSSRGAQDPSLIVDALERLNVSALFMIGGDGTMRATAKIVDEVKARNRRIAVIGIPKTIDNDINFVTRSFGFDSAVDKATEAIRCAHAEAMGAVNGIGLVKLMGRDSGHIAAQSALSLKDVNFVLIPEQRFELHGEKGFLAALHQRLKERKHAVIVAAEGAGQDHCPPTGQTDASGNPVLADFCSVLIGEIRNYFKEREFSYTLKFIDPSYLVRSVPANSNDRIYCGFLGQNSVHAAMAGKTGMVISRWNGRYVHIPLALVTSGRKYVDTTSNFWRAVVETTGQPDEMSN